MHIERMHSAMETLSAWLVGECGKGQCKFDLCAAGQVSDMLKDLAEASKNCAKKMYYDELYKMLKMEREDMESDCGDGRMGYDHYRYKSTGQFAPTGHGTYSGYTPLTGKVHVHEPYLDGTMKMGYTDDRRRDDASHANMDGNVRMGHQIGMRDEYYPSKYGTGYDAYQMAKRHYTESKDEGSRKKMNEKIDETVLDSVDVLREMWRDATPDVRQRMKQQVEKLSKEMV